MKLIVDECTAGAVVAWLRSAGFELVLILELRSGTSDREVLERAELEQGLIITQDRDFGELVVAQKVRARGVILLELEQLSQTRQAQRVAECLKHGVKDFVDAFTVIEPARIRRRMLIA